MDNKNIRPIENPEAVINFLEGLVKKHADFARHIDNQADILIGLNAAIFAFIAAVILKTEGKTPMHLIALIFFSVLSGIIALFAVHPPKFMRKKGQKESLLLYNRKIASFSPEAYISELKNLLKNQDALIDEFGLEIYNISKYYYRPKRTLFTYSRDIFILGLVISFLLFLVG